MPGLSARFQKVLEARRDGLNARFRRLGSARRPAAFLAYLSRTVDPLVDAAGDDEADAVALALFDLGLAGMGTGLVGEDAPTAFEQALVALLPGFRPHFPREVGPLVRALGNAWARLAREVGPERAGWWMSTLAAAAPQCPTRPVLFDVGLALSWRAGLAEARATALQRTLALDPPFRSWIFGAPAIDPSPARRFAPPGSTAPLGPVAIVGRVGGFVGFGGPFAVPPRVFASGDRLFATDGHAVGEVHADVYGARLCPAGDGVELLNSAIQRLNSVPRGSAGLCDASGLVSWDGQAGVFPDLAGASSAAAAAAMLAVTVEDSHWVAVLGRPAEDAP